MPVTALREVARTGAMSPVRPRSVLGTTRHCDDEPRRPVTGPPVHALSISLSGFAAGPGRGAPARRRRERLLDGTAFPARGRETVEVVPSTSVTQVRLRPARD